MKIFVTKNGKRRGPYSPAQLKEMLARGEVSMSDSAWYEGCAEWCRIQEMPELIKCFSQSAKAKTKIRGSKPSMRFSKARLAMHWKKFRTQRTLQVVIVCATALIAFWIWTQRDRGAKEGTVITSKPAEVNLNAIQSVINQDKELTAAMRLKRKVIQANTDEALNTLSVVIKTYAMDGLRIKLSDCPRDFADAYAQFYSAWLKESEGIAAHPHIPDGSGPIVEGFFRNLDLEVIDTMTEPPEGMTDWFDQVTADENKVRTAQQAVQSITVRYGVRVGG